jgi:hypothetical protein
VNRKRSLVAFFARPHTAPTKEKNKKQNHNNNDKNMEVSPGIYSQNCLKRSPWGPEIGGCARQMAINEGLF